MTGYKVRIYPTKEQEKQIWKNIHAARAVYNIALNMEQQSYAEGKRIRYFELRRRFIVMRNTDPKYAWLQEVSLETIAATLRNLMNAFEKYFSGQNRHPKFKSRKTHKFSYQCRSDRTHVDGEFIRISGLSGSSHRRDRILAKKHGIPEGKRLWSTTIKTDGYGKYWFCCNLEDEDIMIDMSDTPKADPIGVDVGIRNMITTSDGDFYHYSNTTLLEKRLKKLVKRFNRTKNEYLRIAKRTKTKYYDIPKSNNFKKLKKERADLERRISNIRLNDIHTATKQIVDRNPSAIVIETISVREQIQENKAWITSLVPQMRYYEIHRQLKYKAYRRGIPIIVADRQYASSKICSCCGNRGTTRKYKTFHCPYCGYEEDRDLNAAYNLRNLAYQQGF